MNNLDLEKILSAFVGSPECQKINDALLETIRAAYEAGWNAATEQITALEAVVKVHSREIEKLKKANHIA